MDKQIIIDESDISECPISPKCIEFGDCKIKLILEQLKAKEQECEELNKQLISFMNGDYCANGCSLKQQLDQLKAENETYKKMLDDTEVRVALIDVKTGDRELWRNLGMKADKFKQTLAEIKEIAEEYEELHGFLDCSGDLILQKISEVEK